MLRSVVRCCFGLVEDVEDGGESGEDAAGHGQVPELLAEEELRTKGTETGQAGVDVGLDGTEVLDRAAGMEGDAVFGEGQESRYCSRSARFSSVPMTTSNSSMGSSPFGPASGVATTWLSHADGGVRKKPTGRLNPRANATSSSAVISRTRPPSTDRSRADQLAGESRVPK